MYVSEADSVVSNDPECNQLDEGSLSSEGSESSDEGSEISEDGSVTSHDSSGESHQNSVVSGDDKSQDRESGVRDPTTVNKQSSLHGRASKQRENISDPESWRVGGIPKDHDLRNPCDNLGPREAPIQHSSTAQRDAQALRIDQTPLGDQAQLTTQGTRAKNNRRLDTHGLPSRQAENHSQLHRDEPVRHGGLTYRENLRYRDESEYYDDQPCLKTQTYDARQLNADAQRRANYEPKLSRSPELSGEVSADCSTPNPTSMLCGRSNWSIWSHWMRLRLKSKGLWALVEKPVTDNTRNVVKESERVEASMLIIEHLHPSCHTAVQAHDDPYIIWNELGKCYAKRHRSFDDGRGSTVRRRLEEPDTQVALCARYKDGQASHAVDAAEVKHEEQTPQRIPPTTTYYLANHATQPTLDAHSSYPDGWREQRRQERGSTSRLRRGV